MYGMKVYLPATYGQRFPLQCVPNHSRAPIALKLMKVKIFLQKSKIALRGMRFQRLAFIFRGSSTRLLHYAKRAVHQHNKYHKTSTRKYGVLPSFRLDSAFVKTWLFCYDLISTHSNYRCVLKALNGVTYVAPLIDSVGLGDRLRFYKNALRFYYFIKTGSVSPLHFLKPGFLVSNVGRSTPTFATSRGTYAVVGTYKQSSALLTLPSGVKKLVPSDHKAFIGRNAGIYQYKEYWGKAYLSRHRRHRVIVRSCAKNPVDHPNGGRTRGKQLMKSP
jgi:hypothetical protein